MVTKLPLPCIFMYHIDNENIADKAKPNCLKKVKTIHEKKLTFSVVEDQRLHQLTVHLEPWYTLTSLCSLKSRNDQLSVSATRSRSLSVINIDWKESLSCILYFNQRMIPNQVVNAHKPNQIVTIVKKLIYFPLWFVAMGAFSRVAWNNTFKGICGVFLRFFFVFNYVPTLQTNFTWG